MDQNTIIGIVVVLVVVLILGWSKNVFWFAAGIAGGFLFYTVYQNGSFRAITGGGSDLKTIGVAGFSAVLQGGKKRLQLPAVKFKQTQVPQYSLDVFRPVPGKTSSTKLEIVLQRREKSRRGMLVQPGGKKSKFYLDSYDKGTYRKIRTIADMDKEVMSPQKTENHSRMLELLAKLLRKLWDGKEFRGLKVLAVSKTPEFPEGGLPSVLANVPHSYHQLADSDYLRNVVKSRGTVDIVCDGESIKMPIVEKHPPPRSDLETTPLYHRIADLAATAQLVVVVQDFVSPGFSRGWFPRNVIYIGQSSRSNKQEKLVANAFIVPNEYSYIIHALKGMLLDVKPKSPGKKTDKKPTK